MFSVHHLVKRFGSFHALGPISFDVTNERVVAIVGPSGCGKSTLLRLIAGLDRQDSGAILLDDEAVAGIRPDISVAFQEPRLMPWLTVADNIEFGIWDWPKSERTQAVQDMLHKVGLTSFADALVKQLSGGMAQRVGLARALVGRPKLLLMDEPFSALDPLTRIRMQDHLMELVGTDVPNVLLITHDVDEAIVLADRIIVLQGPPARIELDLHVDLPRPRIRTEAQFQAVKQQLLERLLRHQDSLTTATAFTTKETA